MSDICISTYIEIDVDIVVYRFSEPTAMSLQKLLGLPTLRRAKVHCVDLSPEFALLWGQSSVRDVMLTCLGGTDEASTQPLQGAPIAPESLWLAEGGATLALRIMRNPSPFDLSHLKVLKINSRYSDFPWQSFAQVVPTIETLHCVASNPLAPVHLSMFPRLSHLRVRLENTSKSPILLNLLAGVTRSTRLRTITLSITSFVIHGIPASEVTPPVEVYDQIDVVLSTLPMDDLPSLELEQDPAEYDQIIPYFPRMSSKNLIRRIDRTRT